MPTLRPGKKPQFLPMVPIGTFSEPCDLSGTEADGGSRLPQCFYAGNRIICDLFRHARCGIALPHGRIQRANAPVHDLDTLTSGAGVLFRPLPDLNAPDEQPQQLGCQSVDGKWVANPIEGTGFYTYMMMCGFIFALY